MPDLINGEFDLNGFAFGTDRSGYPLVPGGFEVGSPDFRDEDENNPLGDGVMFGKDLLGGVTYSFELVTYHEGPDGWQEASKALSRFRAAWHGHRHTNARYPHQMDRLTLWYGNEPGVVFGRPRRYAETRTRLRKGIGYITCDFRAVNDLVYSADEYRQNIPIVPASSGGLEAPLEAPLTSAGVSVPREGYITVGGDTAVTPSRIQFNGPVTNPWLQLTGGWRIGMNIDLAPDQYVRIDPRPWSSRVLLYPGGRSVAGRLSQYTPAFPDILLHPGDHEFEFGGVDVTGTASVDLYWRTARHAV